MNTNQTPVNDTPTGPVAKYPFNEISILFPLLTLYTVGYMGLMAAEFFLRGALRMPSGLMPIYIALVGAYAADKEIRRWAGATEPPRKGSLFVYLWALLYLAAFIFRTFRPEFILPAEFGPVVLQVVGIFFGSRASKGIYEWRIKPEDKDPAVISQRQDLIMALIRARGRVKNKEVADQLVISSATAQRLLSDMVAKGLIRQVGERKAASYEAIILNP